MKNLKTILLSILLLFIYSLSAKSQTLFSSPIQDTSVFISNSQLNGLSTTSVDLLPFPDVDSTYVILQVLGQLVDNGNPYNTSVSIAAYSNNGISSGSLHVFSSGSSFLTFNSCMSTLTITNGTLGTSQYLKGGKIILKTGTSPTSGASDLYLYIRYYKILSNL